jgi:hypothetical protein
MRMHGPWYARLSRVEHQMFERLADEARPDTVAAISGEITHLTARVDLMRARVTNDRIDNACRFRVSDFQWTPADIEAITDIIDDPGFHDPANIAVLRAAAAEPHGEPTPAEMAEVTSFAQEHDYSAAGPPIPDWVRHVLQHRDEFVCAALRVPWAGAIEDSKLFLFLFGHKTERGAGFIELLPPPQRVPVGPVEGLSDDDLAATMTFNVAKNYTFGVEMPDVEVTDLAVLPNIRHLSDGVAEHRGIGFVPYLTFLGPALRQPTREAAAPREITIRSADRAFIEDVCPWMLRYMRRENTKPHVKKHTVLKEKKKKRKNEARGSRDPPPPDSDRDDPDEEEIEDGDLIAAQLAAIRVEWDVQPEPDAVLSDFSVAARGGRWTKRTKKTIADSMRGIPVGKLGKDWCKIFGQTKSKTYAVLKYTPEVAGILARSWAHRCQYFLDVYTRSGDEYYEYTDADFNRYVPSSEYAAFCASPMTEVAAVAAAELADVPKNRKPRVEVLEALLAGQAEDSEDDGE